MRLSAGRIRILLFFALIIIAVPSMASGDEGQQNTGLKIEIISPNDGEIFYAGKLGYIVSLPITGLVSGSEGSPESVDVQLVIWSVHGSTEPLHTRPDKDGFFAFYLDLNPDNEPLPSVGERFFYYNEVCSDCHFATNNVLPPGPLRLEFTATAADGQMVTAEKRMTVDRSQYATIPVEVVLDGVNGAALDNIPVQAETRLYSWRGRRFIALTDTDGRAELRVEALSQRDTRYLLSVSPTLIHDMRYRSLATTEVVIPPGTTIAEAVRLVVIVENGAIAGNVVTDLDLSAGAAVAIAWPSGNLYQEEIRDDNSFTFSGLPLGEYLVSVTTGDDEAQDTFAQPEKVDLAALVSADVSLVLEEPPAADLVGQIVDERGQPIPFGWLTIGNGAQNVQVSPIDGRFLLRGVDDDLATVNITSPGFWNQSETLSEWAARSKDGKAIVLKARPDNEEIAWGSGHMLAPRESVFVNEDNVVSLVRGWIWGRNEQPEPVAINMEGAQIEMEAADFALEYAPGEASWIYVKDGRVTYTSREGASTVIEAGEMMALGDGVPAPYPVSAIGLAIGITRNGRTPTAPLLYEKEPSTAQRVGQALASAGNTLVQSLVAITYLVMFLLIIGAILFGARRFFMARS
jgi:hypothetical protein